MSGIQEIIEQILTYIKGVWIKKRYIMIATWLICPIGWFAVVSMPDVYESSARVYVDTNSLLRPLLRGLAIYNNPEQQVTLVARTLKGRPTLEKIAREADLDITAQNQEEMNALIDNLKNKIKLGSTRERDIYTISFKSERPGLAQRIVQITLNEFVESSLGGNRQSSDSAEEFINRQIKEYEQRLVEAEERLAEFKRSRMDRAAGSAQDYYGQLQSEKNQLEEARLRLKELESQLASAKAQLVGEEPVFGLMTPEFESGNSGISTQYDSRIASLQQRLDSLLIQYTEQHPDVRKINSLIEHLKSERKKQLERMAQSASSTGSYSSFGNLNQNPVYQQMKINVANLESQISSLRVRVKSYQSRVENLEDKLDLVPQIEAEFQALNRDYGIVQSKYLELLERRDSAQLSRKAEATTDDVQFRIIDPPNLPTKPAGPPRLMFYTMVLVLGYGAGLGIAFLMSQISPVVLSANQLKEMFNIPLLGTVAHFEAEQLRAVSRQRNLIFYASSGAILSVYMGLMLIEILFGGLPTALMERFL